MEGSLKLYEFGEDAEKAITDFMPDVIYYQAEWWSRQGYKCMKLAHKLKTKFVLFVWENLRIPEQDWHKEVIKSADLVICGNNAARNIVLTVGCNVCKMPQVGIDTELFKPMDIEKKWNLMFVGRQVPEKGINIIKNVCERLGIHVELVSGVPYEKLPKFYNRAHIFITFPYKVDWWCEQFAPYTSLEALSCALPIITSNSGSIPEWIVGIPGVVMLQEKDKWALEHTLKAIKWEDRKPNYQGREVVIAKFSKEIVAKVLREVLRKVTEGEVTSVFSDSSLR